MNYVFLLALAAIIFTSFMGIVSKRFNDNLLQRISLGGIILMCCSFFTQVLHNEEPKHFDIFVILTALYGMATIWKFRNGRYKV